jgi:hypothetical protein
MDSKVMLVLVLVLVVVLVLVLALLTRLLLTTIWKGLDSRFMAVVAVVAFAVKVSA